MLSDRRRHVLAALIEEYVARALPVGSRTLIERYNLRVSSATVRNELAVLEDEGYLSQPHTSAGRIPTDIGYRSFVDSLLANGVLRDDDDETQRAAQQLRDSATELDDLIERTSSALARFTECLSIVMGPSPFATVIKQITLVGLSDMRAIVVVVMTDGQVFNRQIDFGSVVSEADLSHIQQILNNLLAGHDATEVSGGLFSSENFCTLEPLVGVVLDEVIACLRENDILHAHRLGMSSLMQQPEFQQTESLLPIVQVLEDDTVLLQILDMTTNNAEAPSVCIGHENAMDGLADVSVVASRYGRGAATGVVAVIGPTRMDYSKVMRAVRIARIALEED